MSRIAIRNPLPNVRIKPNAVKSSRRVYTQSYKFQVHSFENLPWPLQ